MLTVIMSSCREDYHKDTYNYEIIYTDGSSEFVTTIDKIEFDGNNGCIKTCGCSEGKLKRCGVRNFKEIDEIEPIIEPKDSVNLKPDSINYIKNIKNI